MGRRGVSGLPVVRLNMGVRKLGNCLDMAGIGYYPSSTADTSSFRGLPTVSFLAKFLGTI